MIKSNNVLPLVESNEWKTEDTELKVLALYDKTDDGLVITLDSKSYGVGKWIVNVPVSEKQTYKISVTAQTESVVHDVYAIINIIARPLKNETVIVIARLMFADCITTPTQPNITKKAIIPRMVNICRLSKPEASSSSISLDSPNRPSLISVSGMSNSTSISASLSNPKNIITVWIISNNVAGIAIQ